MSARQLLVALAVTSGLLTGCGSTPVTLTAATEVPSLTASLSSVDAALGQGRYGAARSTLLNLINQTRQAERSGSISAATATRIVDAARQVLALLPHAGARAHSTPTPPAITSVTSSPKPKQPKKPKKPKPAQAPVPAPKPSSPAHPHSPPPPSPSPAPAPTPTPTPAAAPASVTTPSS